MKNALPQFFLIAGILFAVSPLVTIFGSSSPYATLAVFYFAITIPVGLLSVWIGIAMGHKLRKERALNLDQTFLAQEKKHLALVWRGLLLIGISMLWPLFLNVLTNTGNMPASSDLITIVFGSVTILLMIGTIAGVVVMFLGLFRFFFETTSIQAGVQQELSGTETVSAPIQKFNTLAIISLIVAILTVGGIWGLISVGLGLFALNQITRKQEKGKWIAIAAIVIGLGSTTYRLLVASGLL